MITLGSETIFDVIDEVEPLLRAHYCELAKNQDRVHLKPDWDRYVALERIGGFLLYTARDENAELVGYAAFFASTHPHYMELMLVSNDVLYLAPSHRVGRTGIRLIRYCEERIFATYGKQCALTWHCKENTPLAGMLGRMGYGVQDVVMSKLF